MLADSASIAWQDTVNKTQATMPGCTQSRRSVRIHDLPVEIQLMIYENVFGLYDIINKSSIDSSWCRNFVCQYRDDAGESNQPRQNILRVCKAISGIASDAQRRSFSGVICSNHHSYLTVDFKHPMQNFGSLDRAQLLLKAQIIKVTPQFSPSALIDIAKLFPSLKVMEMEVDHHMQIIKSSNWSDSDEFDKVTAEMAAIHLLSNSSDDYSRRTYSISKDLETEGNGKFNYVFS